MLIEESVIDSINVKDSGHIEVRRADKIIKDGKEIAKTYHRHVLTPGDNLEGQDEKVISIANAVWTPELIASFQE